MFVEVRPPNLNAELYKNHQVDNKIYKHLSFIDIHQDGSTVVGACDLTGRHWDGTINISKSPWDFVLDSSSDSNISKIFTDRCVTDGKFLKDPTKIIVSDDYGDLRIWSRQKCWTDMGTPTSNYGWCISNEISCHDDAILSLDLFTDEDICVTAGGDSTIKVWDIEKLTALMRYPAHTHLVTDVMCSPTHKNIFVSSSLDRTIALWHYMGSENKAKVFGKMPCAARCVCWISENLFVGGYDNGDICFFDSRNEKSEEVIPTIHSKYPIERMVFNHESKMLGTCGDSSTVDVYVVKESETKNVYSNSEAHCQFVRALHWEDSHLYSCGWDGRVVNHDLLSNKTYVKENTGCF